MTTNRLEELKAKGVDVSHFVALRDIVRGKSCAKSLLPQKQKEFAEEKKKLMQKLGLIKEEAANERSAGLAAGAAGAANMAQVAQQLAQQASDHAATMNRALHADGVVVATEEDMQAIQAGVTVPDDMAVECTLSI